MSSSRLRVIGNVRNEGAANWRRQSESCTLLILDRHLNQVSRINFVSENYYFSLS